MILLFAWNQHQDRSNALPICSCAEFYLFIVRYSANMLCSISRLSESIARLIMSIIYSSRAGLKYNFIQSVRTVTSFYQKFISYNYALMRPMVTGCLYHIKKPAAFFSAGSLLNRCSMLTGFPFVIHDLIFCIVDASAVGMLGARVVRLFLRLRSRAGACRRSPCLAGLRALVQP
jgi:hypothetical protein